MAASDVLHLSNILRFPDVEVKKIADIKVEATQEYLAGINAAAKIEFTADYHDILNDPEIKAVFILSSTSTHAQMSIEAAQAGKDIFCEKPIDYDIPRIHEVLHAIEEAGVKYQIGFNRRFDHNFRRIREVVQSGEIGDPHIVKVCARDPGYNIDYIRDSAKSGGILFDMSIHDLDMARYLTGLDVEEVYVSGGAIFDPEIGEAGDADTVVVLLKFKGGAMGIIDNSRQAVYGYDQRIEVFGSAGMAITPNDRPSLVEVYTKEPPKTDKIHYFFLERFNQAFIDEVAEFFASIRENRSPLVTGIDGLNAVLIAAAGKKSLEEHRPVTIAEVDTE